MFCYFCKKNIDVDFKDIKVLKRHISTLGRIRKKEKTGTCSKHQRKVSIAIKRARSLGLLSATVKDF